MTTQSDVAHLMLAIEAHIDSRVRRALASDQYVNGAAQLYSGSYPGNVAMSQRLSERMSAQEACDHTQRNLHAMLMKALIPEGT
jgi:hypothetical protein